MKTKDTRNLPVAALTELRSRAVAAVRAGQTRAAVARLLKVSRQTVGQWVADYARQGEASLVYRQRGRPKGGRLSRVQKAAVARAIVDRQPDQLKLPFFLWTREAVGTLIRRRFGVRLSVWTVGRLLRDLGFTPQKPARRAREQDPEEVLGWLEERYPAVRAEARRRGAVILWEDEMGLRSDDQVGRTYGLRGQTPVAEVAGARFGCNMISAVSNRGRLYFMVFKKRFRAPVFLEFLGRLVKQVQRPILLIVDKHPVHRARTVRDWVRAQAGRLWLVYLPPYSPDLNPDEMLNQDVKANTVRKQRPSDQAQMMGQVRGYLRGRQRRPALVKRYFHHPCVRYAAS